ncbi:MAG TPA: extracellular solute-binding protein [Candidatus Limnocylindrales bacterium]
MGKRGLSLITLAAIPMFVLGACGQTSNASPTPSTEPSSAAQGSAASASSGAITWFVGLGSGTQPNQIDAEKAFVASYNKLNKDGITITLKIVPHDSAYDVLKTDIARGDAPDLIGPVGVKDRNGFEGLFLDLTQEIAKNNYDVKAFADPAVEFFRDSSGAQIGLPYLVNSGYIWYNKDAFAKAGLPNLPTTVGEMYQGKTWDWNALGAVAAQLTLDKKGKKSTDSGFDKANIVQYGVDFQGLDARRIGSLFGSGSFVDSDGKTATIPAVWAEAYNWYYDAIWKSHYAPNATVEASALLNQGNSMASGNVAMSAAWGTSISSLWDSKTSTAKMKSWDIGVIPSWKGNTTSPMDADTFVIAKASKNPDAAFKAMVAIEADPTLMQDYGGLPVKASAQAAYTQSMDATLSPIFPGIKVTWSVLNEMLMHPASPSDQVTLPASTQATTDYGALLTKLQTKDGLDVNAELTKLQAILQADYAAVQPLNQ